MMNNLTIKERCQAIADGKELQIRLFSNYIDFNVNSDSEDGKRFFNKELEFRIKPKPVKVFGIEVEGIAEPLTLDKVKFESAYFRVSTNNKNGYCEDVYNEWNSQKTAINRGMCWKSEDDIKKVVRALGLVE